VSNQLQTEMSPNGHTLNDLIHSNARVAFDTGVKTERERITNLFASKLRDYERLAVYNRAIGDSEKECDNRDAITLLSHFMTLIKGEQK
jgi:hypothetical protein